MIKNPHQSERSRLQQLLDQRGPEYEKNLEQQKSLEKSLIGSILRSPEVAPRAVLAIGPEMFMSSAGAEIFRAISEIVRKGQSIDLVTLGEELKARGKLVEVGGAPALLSLHQHVLTAANIDRYIDLMRQSYRLRRIEQIGTDMALDAVEQTPPDEILASAGTKLTALVHLSRRHEGKKMGAVMSDALMTISDRIKNKSSLAVPTGLAAFDAKHGGLFPENMITIAARPGVGKTAIGLALASAASRQTKVVFCSIEMSLQQLAERYLSAESGVEAKAIRRGEMSKEEAQKIIAASDRLSELPIESLDLPGATLDQVLLSIRASAMREPIGLLIVDYLQKIKKSNPRLQNNEHISECSAAMATLSRDLRCPVVVLAQLNRESDKRKNSVPLLADLKGSGSIEEDSDVVILLHWPHGSNRKHPKHKLELFVAKNRHGETGPIDVGFDQARMKFFVWNQDQGDFVDQAGGV